jgi:GTP-binding protein HflX
MIETREAISEKAVLIGIITQHQDEKKSEEYLDELEFLTHTAGGLAVKRFVQKLDKPHPKTFIGTGKLEDVKAYIDSNDIGTAIFDDELSPAQLRNVERFLDCKILDRTN